MSTLKDLTGQRFGRLTVIERAENIGKQTAWLCRCDCGNEVIVRGLSLKQNRTKSCGCLHNEGNNTIHGMFRTSIYNVWSNMKRRCLDPNNNRYSTHGARGITVCERWLKFENFFEDVSKLPHFGEKGYSLDRIDNNGNYEPNNVRWANDKTQSRNRRNNHLVDYNGKLITVTEASEKSGIKWQTLLTRIRAGDNGERLFRPVRKHK